MAKKKSTFLSASATLRGLRVAESGLVQEACRALKG